MYTITKNAQFGSLEISFNEKPSEAIREALKAMRFRWHSVKKVWYGRASVEAVEAAISGKPEAVQDQPEEKAQAKSGKSAAKVDKELLRAEYSKVWETEKMIDYCVNKTAAVAILPAGEIITIDKQAIETRFCFGESGYDFEEASAAAAHAATSESYFKRENMKSFNSYLKDLEGAKTFEGRTVATIHPRAWSGQADDCRLSCLNWKRLTAVLDDLGGSAFLSELPGKTIEKGEHSYRVLTNEEIDIIEAAVKAAAEAHEKKVDAYLKRYGMSKVHTWTYWRDA